MVLFEQHDRLGPLPGYVAVLATVVLVVPLVHRLTTPVPPGDMDALESFLRNRDQTLLKVEKLWFGGPQGSGRYPYFQVGRPYRVLARDSDGTVTRHILAASQLPAAHKTSP